jgi:hypothetical protein
MTAQMNKQKSSDVHNGNCTNRVSEVRLRNSPSRAPAAAAPSTGSVGCCLRATSGTHAHDRCIRCLPAICGGSDALAGIALTCRRRTSSIRFPTPRYGRGLSMIMSRTACWQYSEWLVGSERLQKSVLYSCCVTTLTTDTA